MCIRDSFSTGDGPAREPALCQLHRHTFVPYTWKGQNRVEAILSMVDSLINLQRSGCVMAPRPLRFTSYYAGRVRVAERNGMMSVRPSVVRNR